MERVGDSRREVLVTGRGPQARHVEVGFLDIAAALLENPLDQRFRTWMMNEPGLEHGQDLRILLGGHVVLRGLRVQRTECLAYQLAGQLNERERTGTRGVH